MSLWLLANLPGMIFNSMLEGAAVTLLAYLLCTVLTFIRGMAGVRIWHLLAVFVIVLFFQGVIGLAIQMICPHPESEEVLFIVISLAPPIIISTIALSLLKLWHRKSIVLIKGQSGHEMDA